MDEIIQKNIDDRSKEFFYVDIEGQEFKNGIRLNRWGFIEPSLLPEEKRAWPNFCFWVKAAERDNSPDKFCIFANLANYPSFPPTGSLWDLEKKDFLPVSDYPKMKTGSACERIFTTGWRPSDKKDMGFYCHFDREALKRHPEWVRKYPDQAWTHEHTIADYLNFFFELLSGRDYEGVRK